MKWLEVSWILLSYNIYRNYNFFQSPLVCGVLVRMFVSDRNVYGKGLAKDRSYTKLKEEDFT